MIPFATHVENIMYLLVSARNDCLSPGPPFLYLLADCLLCREISYIGFHLCRGQLHKRVTVKNTLEEDGQIGLEELRSFSRRKNGNSGSLLYFF